MESNSAHRFVKTDLPASHTSQGLFTNKALSKYHFLESVPGDHRLSFYPLASDIIQQSAQDFKRTELFFPDGLLLQDALDFIIQLYTDTSNAAPELLDICYVFKKHGYNKTSKIKWPQYMKILEELSGKRRYSEENLKTSKNENEGPKLILYGKYPLSKSMLSELPAIFRLHDIDQDGLVDLSSVLGIFAVLFSSDKQPAPSKDDLFHFLEFFEMPKQLKFNLSIVKRLLKIVAGYKNYTQLSKFSDSSKSETPNKSQNLDEITRDKILVSLFESGTNLQPQTMLSDSAQTDEYSHFIDNYNSHLNSVDEFLPMHFIQKAKLVFDKYDKDWKGVINIEDLMSVLGELFHFDGHQKPKSELVGTLLLKMGFFKKDV
jgi:Ca2+-binding EF-hand superfamily protein